MMESKNKERELNGMMPVPWRLWESQVVDHCFPLRRYLGSTHHSAVYLTQVGDPEPRNAAIKLILDGQPDALPPEWGRAAQLSHPNLIQLYRSGSCQIDRLPLRYVVMEYADEDLAGVLAERALTTDEVRDMLKPLLEALSYIHGAGMVHGRLKPANILAVGEQLKLSVDGVSLVGEPGTAPTVAGPYDPPEFAESGCSPVGDIWSFGMTLVEALTQQLPVVGGTKQEPVLPDTLPGEFLPIVQVCLRLDPRRRASPMEILAQYERKVPQVAQAPVVDAPVVKRKWLGPALVSAATLALAAIVIVPRFTHEAPAAQPGVVSASTREAPKQAAPPIAATVKSEPAVAIAKPTPFSPAPASHGALSTTGKSEPPAVVTKPTRTVEAKTGLVAHEVLPEVTEQARRTIRGKVVIRVRARVDASGRVNDAEVESENSRYFAKLALQAARQWGFEADASGEWLLRFELTTKGTTVQSSRVVR